MEKVTKSFDSTAFLWACGAAALVMAANGYMKHRAATTGGSFRGVENLFIPAA